MLCRMAVLLSVVPLIVILAALIDIISRPEDQVRHLPKLVWVLLVVFLPLVGSLVWFAIGREYPARAERRIVSAPQGASSADNGQGARRVRSTEDELAALEREIEFHQQQARIRAREAELAERHRLAEDA